MKGYF